MFSHLCYDINVLGMIQGIYIDQSHDKRQKITSYRN